jgi:hypothetical protein
VSSRSARPVAPASSSSGASHSARSATRRLAPGPGGHQRAARARDGRVELRDVAQYLPAAPCAPLVAARVGALDRACGAGPVGVAQAERRDDPPFDLAGGRPPGDLLDDHAEEDVVRRRVRPGPLRTRPLQRERHQFPGGEVVRPPSLRVLPVQRVGVVGQAAGVPQELPHGDPPAVVAVAGDQTGQMVLDRVVQADPVFRHELEQHGGGERLGGAADADPVTGAHRAAGPYVGPAEGRAPGRARGRLHPHGGARHPVLAGQPAQHPERRRVVTPARPVPGRPVPGRRGRGRRGQHHAQHRSRRRSTAQPASYSLRHASPSVRAPLRRSVTSEARDRGGRPHACCPHPLLRTTPPPAGPERGGPAARHARRDRERGGDRPPWATGPRCPCRGLSRRRATAACRSRGWRSPTRCRTRRRP